MESTEIVNREIEPCDRDWVRSFLKEHTASWSNTPGFAISPDGRWLLYTSLESTDADLMLVNNFR
jgi:hypothetical protein